MKRVNRFAVIGLVTGLGLVLSPTAAPALSEKTVKTTGEKPVSTQSASSPDGTPHRSRMGWLISLDDGYAEARQLNRPILVRAGATWCGWCRKLSDEIKKPSVQEALSRYVLVYLDIDDSPRDAQSLGIGTVPALRILNAGGRVVASHNGYMAADELAEWLGKQLSKATAVMPAGLTREGPLDAKTVQELIDQLRGREALFREAAIQRLAAEPRLAAPAVVKTFTEGTLSERLAALELLEAWKAPIQNLDPWRPETITPQRLEALQAWIRQMGDAPASAPARLAEDVLDNARRELARLVQADHDAEAEVVRERLARLGPALLPLVAAELKQAATDRDRERLTALRYRLAAPTRLVLEWPGGLERLASTDAPTRQRAAEDLASRAQADASGLLRELFSNPDPLVREISLRTLRKVGGEEANEALTGLLGDPEPNVRAAVLKQLAEQPSRTLVPKLAEYAAVEKDPDLLVHAVRALRAAGGKDALDALGRMTGHDAWQVRAEVAEAIGGILSESGDLPQQSRADAYVALIGLLKDPDGFVTSRAMTGLSYADVNLVMKPLVQAALDHPEMAGPLVEMLADRGGDPGEIGKHLRELLTAKHAAVRAAAIEHFCRLLPRESEKELLTAFVDPEDEVRFAAARGLLLVLTAYRPTETPFVASYEYQTEEIVETRSSLIGRVLGLSSSRVVVRARSSSPASMPSQSQPAADSDWLANFRSGVGRPKWMEQVIPPLEGLLSGTQWDRRLTACIGLIALGRDEAALPVLREVVRSQRSAVSQAAQALGWLPLSERVSLFRELLSLATETQLTVDVINSLAILPDPQAAAPLWELLGQNDFSSVWVNNVQASLRRLHLGPEHEWSNVKAERRRQLVADVTRMTEKGPELRQLVALSLLLTGSTSDAVAAARKLYESPETAGALRADALQVMLLGQSQEQAVETASAALASSDDNVRGTALIYLARGGNELQWLRGAVSLHLSSRGVAFQDLVNPGGSPISPQAPPGLKAEDVRPLLQSGDAATRAHAGYLLALLKQPEGLGPLVEYWRANVRQDHMWRRQVFRAITALNDDKHTPILNEIYKDLAGETGMMREFYWTIRSMDGEQVLALRKQIRTEVGMDALR
jgi:protein disulfide-isomerase